MTQHSSQLTVRKPDNPNVTRMIPEYDRLSDNDDDSDHSTVVYNSNESRKLREKSRKMTVVKWLMETLCTILDELSEEAYSVRPALDALDTLYSEIAGALDMEAEDAKRMAKAEAKAKAKAEAEVKAKTKAKTQVNSRKIKRMPRSVVETFI